MVSLRFFAYWSFIVCIRHSLSLKCLTSQSVGTVFAASSTLLNDNRREKCVSLSKSCKSDKKYAMTFNQQLPFYRRRSGQYASSSSSADSSVTAFGEDIVESKIDIVSKGLTWSIGDELDKRILLLALPAILNNAILPLVGAADTFWVGRMKNALTLAGQGAANQVIIL